MNRNNACLLHVEDDENDVLLQQYAFKSAGIDNPIQVAQDGQKAVEYLTRAAQAGQAGIYPLPCLVLLDLKLPVRPGLEVLRWIRQQPGLKGLPVVVLTSSQDPTDVLSAYQLGANSFVVKPLDHEDRVRLAHALKSWWLEFNVPAEEVIPCLQQTVQPARSFGHLTASSVSS